MAACEACFQGDFDFVSLEATPAQVLGPILFLFSRIDFLLSGFTGVARETVGIFSVGFQGDLCVLAVKGVFVPIDFLFSWIDLRFSASSFFFNSIISFTWSRDPAACKVTKMVVLAIPRKSYLIL